MSRLAIYTTGSSLILKKPNDKDVVYFYPTKEEKIEALRTYRHDSEYDVHFAVAKTCVFLGCYIYHFMELIEGEDLHLNEFSIFDHKEEYIALLKKAVNIYNRKSKKWYQILTAVYMFENNSYDLTEEQLKDIQQAHDKGVTKKLYTYIIDYLEKV